MNEDNTPQPNDQLQQDGPSSQPPAPPPPTLNPQTQQAVYTNPYQQTYEQQPPQPLQHPKNHKKAIVIAVIVFVLIIGGAVALLLSRDDNNPVVQETIESKVSDDDMSNSDSEKTDDTSTQESPSELVSPVLQAELRGRDTVRKNDINSMYQKLEEFYNENGFYPSQEFIELLFPGIDGTVFFDSSENKIAQTVTTSLSKPTVPYTDAEPVGPQYTYQSYGCDSAESGPVNTCQKYAIYAWLESGEVYSKISLN